MTKTIEELKNILYSSAEQVKSKYDALYTLRNIDSSESNKLLMQTYTEGKVKDSDLLKHEIMYILGQKKNPDSIDFLISVLNNENEAAVVRHEAGEGLSNFIEFKGKILPELQKHTNSKIDVVKSTVLLAIDKMQQFEIQKNSYGQFISSTQEPASPFTEDQLKIFLQKNYKTESSISTILKDPKFSEYVKYQIMYCLRNRNDKQSALIIASLLLNENLGKSSQLMRHEACFILGQFADKIKSEEIKYILVQSIKNKNESQVVRHEAVLAYGAIFGNDEFIKGIQKDQSQIVSESAYII